jgi:hypothetical protein
MTVIHNWLAEGARGVFASPRSFGFYVVLPAVLVFAGEAQASSWEWHWHTGFPTAPIGSGLAWLCRWIGECQGGMPLWWCR